MAFNAVKYVAIWGAKNPALVKQQTFAEPVKNAAFLDLTHEMRIKFRAGFVPVGELLEPVGIRKQKRFKYA